MDLSEEHGILKVPSDYPCIYNPIWVILKLGEVHNWRDSRH